MPEPDFLKDLVIVLGAAVVVVALLRRVGVPSIAGFILTGVLAGPTALGLVDDTHQVELLAEVGVVLLLFGIGLELAVDRLRRLWKAVLLGGGIQVAVTLACTAALARGFGLAPGTAVFLGASSPSPARPWSCVRCRRAASWTPRMAALRSGSWCSRTCAWCR